MQTGCAVAVPDVDWTDDTRTSELPSPTGGGRAGEGGEVNLLRRILSHTERFDIANTAGDIFMRRYKLLRMRWGNLYLHEILRSDEDLCLHDHPWRFCTLVVAGGYEEVLPQGRR